MRVISTLRRCTDSPPVMQAKGLLTPANGAVEEHLVRFVTIRADGREEVGRRRRLCQILCCDRKRSGCGSRGSRGCCSRTGCECRSNSVIHIDRRSRQLVQDALEAHAPHVGEGADARGAVMEVEAIRGRLGAGEGKRQLQQACGVTVLLRVSRYLLDGGPKGVGSGDH
jgi:hypothetical protein